MDIIELDNYTTQLEDELHELLKHRDASDYDYVRVKEIEDELEQIEMRGEWWLQYYVLYLF